MERLTYHEPSGEWGVKGMPEEVFKDIDSRIYGALYRLMEYEDTGITPKQLKEIDELYAEKCTEVAELQRRILRMKGVK